jgi:acyl carrier protein
MDYRSLDTNVIRLVYEELSCNYPVRATDHLYKDLGLDSIELEHVMASLAHRCNKSLTAYEDTLLAEEVATVEDVVKLLSRQPNASAV